MGIITVKVWINVVTGIWYQWFSSRFSFQLLLMAYHLTHLTVLALHLTPRKHQSPSCSLQNPERKKEKVPCYFSDPPHHHSLVSFCYRHTSLSLQHKYASNLYSNCPLSRYAIPWNITLDQNKTKQSIRKWYTNIPNKHECKIPHQSLGNWIQLYIKKFMHLDQVRHIPVVKEWL